MLNERDGGIGGVKLAIEECETGYDTKKGVECYEARQGQEAGRGQSVVDRHHAAAHPEGVGRQDSDPVDGLRPVGLGGRQDFPWIFNPPATYWDGLSMIFKYIGDKEGGLDKLKGKTIGYIYFDGGYGREPIPLLEQFAKDYGFKVKIYPVPPAGDAEPVGAMAQRAPRPSGLDDHVGLGRDEPDRRQGSRQDQLPDGSLHRRLVVRQRGRRAARRVRAPRAICRSTSTASAPTIRRSRTSSNTSSTRARARPPKDKVGENFYNRGVIQLGDRSPRRSATRSSSPARRWSPARTCAAASRRSTSPRRAGRNSGWTASPRRST